MSIAGCDKEGNFNVFSLQDDKAFGAQVAAEIESNPAQYPILDSATYKTAYQHLYRMRDTILNSGKLTYRNEFSWRLRIIKDDTTLNAFCTPGGYIYIYTGLIKFLESEDQLAGVLGHEMAHADHRHSTDALSREYGISLILDIAFGKDKGALARVAAGLTSLKYSRSHETEADDYSVIYLYPTEFDARGAARFFEKLLAQGATSPPEFLSTHPSPANRVDAILAKWTSLGGKVGGTFTSRYAQLKASLP